MRVEEEKLAKMAPKPKKKVSGFDIPGETPKKTHEFFKNEAPEQVGVDVQLGKRGPRKVFLGAEGETPKKVRTFEGMLAPSEVDLASPDRAHMQEKTVLSRVSKYASVDDEQSADPYSSPQERTTRPKTSRGKARPSPEEFVDYVVSPTLSPEPIAVSTAEINTSPSQMLRFDEDEDNAMSPGGGSFAVSYAQDKQFLADRNASVEEDDYGAYAEMNGEASDSDSGDDEDVDEYEKFLHRWQQQEQQQQSSTEPIPERFQAMAMALIGVSMLA